MRRRLLEIYTKPKERCIFTDMYQYSSKLRSFFDNIFEDAENKMKSLDLDYIFNRSGFKTISVLLEYLKDGFVVDDKGDYVKTVNGSYVTWDYVLQQIDYDLINTIIETKFLDKWKKLYDTTIVQFDALNPYTMTVKDNVEYEKGFDNTNTRESGGNSNANKEFDNTVHTDSDTYGFNSDDSVPRDKSDSKQSGTDKNTNVYEEKSSIKNAGQSNSSTNREITRKGNIGNKTAMELIQEQRRQLQYILLQDIYNDLDSVLTRSNYII